MAAIAPTTTVRSDLLGGVQTVGEIDLVTSSLDAVTPVTNQVSAILDRQHFKKSGPQEDFTVTTYQSDKLAIGSHLLRVLFWGVAGVAAVALLVGFSGLVIIMRAEAAASAEEFQMCRRVRSWFGCSPVRLCSPFSQAFWGSVPVRPW